MSWRIKKEVAYGYDEAVEKVKMLLKEEGFGVLTTINVKEKLKEKLDVDFDKYIILGACNPLMAHKALSVERDIGFFLPCNVIVYEQSGKVFVVAVDPQGAIADVVQNTDITCVAGDVREKLEKVIGSL